MYKNSLVKIVANRNSPEIKLVGLKVGPFEEGNVYEVRFWIAEELVRSGIAYFHEGELLDLQILSQKQGRIKLYTGFFQLPEFFYPKLRRFIAQLKEKAMKDPDGLVQYKKGLNMAKDIYRSRKAEINFKVRTNTLTSQDLEKLTPEERALYQIIKTVNESFSKILEWW